jgi:hypothetical protein
MANNHWYLYAFGTHLDFVRAKKRPFMNKSFIAILSIAALSFASCSKDKSPSSGNATMNVYLTDDPSAYDAVWIDIQDVQVNTTPDSDNGWQSLHVGRTGVYNLLAFRNGLDTLLASASLPAGKISQIRLILGSNNSVVVNGVNYPLATPSSQQSGLKLNVQAQLEAGITYKLWIDFDAGRSVVQTGNGKFQLKPVIRTYTEATSGSVKGIVLPPTGVNWVFAIQNTDTVATAKPDQVTGSFVLGGLAAGSYAIAVDASGILKDTTISNVNVTVGQSTNIGTVQLH